MQLKNGSVSFACERMVIGNIIHSKLQTLMHFLTRWDIVRRRSNLNAFFLPLPYRMRFGKIYFIQLNKLTSKECFFYVLFFCYETVVWVVRKIVCSSFFVCFIRLCLKSHLVLKLSRQIFFLWWQIYTEVHDIHKIQLAYFYLNKMLSWKHKHFKWFIPISYYYFWL